MEWNRVYCGQEAELVKLCMFIVVCVYVLTKRVTKENKQCVCVWVLKQVCRNKKKRGGGGKLDEIGRVDIMIGLSARAKCPVPNHLEATKHHPASSENHHCCPQRL